MGPFAISFLFAVGSGVWIYSKMMRSTGGITKNALVVAGISAFIVFIFLLMLMNAISD